MKNNKVGVIVISLIIIFCPLTMESQTNRRIIRDSDSINIYDYPEVIKRANDFSVFIREFNTNTDDYLTHMFWPQQLILIILKKEIYDNFNYYDFTGLNFNDFLKKVDSVYGKENFIDSLVTFDFDEIEFTPHLRFVIYYKIDSDYILEILVSFSEDCYDIKGTKNQRKHTTDRLHKCNKYDFIAIQKS